MPTVRFEDWETTGKTFTHRGFPIFYRDDGRGDAVVLCIHGFPTASWDWHPLWTDLTDRFRVVTLDMIGFGFSAKPRNYVYSIFDQADIFEDLLGFLGVGRVHVLAHDYGDTVAQELLARFEDRKKRGEPGLGIDSVCFLNGGLFPESHRPRLVQKLLNSPLGPIVSRLLNEGGFRKSFAAIFGPDTQPSDAELAEYWALVAAKNGHTIAHKLIRYIDERKANRERWVGALVRTTVPMRVVNGSADPVSGAHMVARYRELVPNPDTVALDNIGHYPQVEAPRAVTDAYLDFLERFDTCRAARSPERNAP